MSAWPNTWINFAHDEWEALVDEPAEYMKVYLALKKLADFQTGIVRVSEAVLLGLLSPPPKKGRHQQERPTRKTVRSLIGQLEGLGLLERRKENGESTFFLPKGSWGLVRSGDEGPMRGQGGATKMTDDGPQKTTQKQPVTQHEGPEDTSRGTDEVPMRGPLQITTMQEEKTRNTTVANATVLPLNAGAVQQVFAHWQAVMEKPRAQLDDKRRKAIAGRLKDGYSVAELCEAIDGCRASRWHMGANDRNRPFNDVELICRNASKVDQFRGCVAAGRSDAAELDAFLQGGDGNFIEGEFSHG